MRKDGAAQSGWIQGRVVKDVLGQLIRGLESATEIDCGGVQDVLRCHWSSVRILSCDWSTNDTILASHWLTRWRASSDWSSGGGNNLGWDPLELLENNGQI